MTELSKIIEEIASKEIKKAILNENNNMEVYHIKCEGIPVATFDSMEEANTFIQTHYPDKIYNIVYSDNKLTQHYLKRKASTV